jgi:hypothetical protein
LVFKGDSHGQSKEASCDAQESLETWKGKWQACAQEGIRSDAKKAATEDREKNGTKKSAKTTLAGCRRHDHRRGR